MDIVYLSPKTFTQKGVTMVRLQEGLKDSRFIVDAQHNTTLVLGIEKKKQMTQRKLQALFRKIIVLAKQHKLKSITLNFSDFVFPHLKISTLELAETMAIHFEMANFEFVRYKTKPEDGWNIVETAYVLGSKNPSIEQGIQRGNAIGQEVNNCRILANTPGGDMTPKLLARAAEHAVKKLGVKVSVLDEAEIRKLGMGGILGVAKGSHEKPTFIIMEYLPRKTGRPVVLVGKGVTFDSGGLNIKTGDGMLEMNMDMTGGAAVIHAIAAVAKLQVKKNVIGLIPAVENMPSGASFRPGDILRTMSGKTIEVVNTDAEGRVILADALSYAKQYRPRLVVDIATLTGSAQVALGQRASALFTKDEKLEKLFRQLGEKTGDAVWPLPLWEEYEDEVRGTFGDWANIGKTRWGGAIHGAIFLYQFAKEYPWVHLDIAPRMASIEGEYLARGSLGTPVRLLVKLIEKF